MFWFALFIGAILFLIAAIHLIWAFRIWWPGGDEESLARSVAGFRNIRKMPSAFQCGAVSFSMVGAAAAVIYLGAGSPFGGSVWLQTLCALFAAVFLTRGVLGFTQFWAGLTPEIPFRTLDRKYYSPLCILLGVGIVTILILG